MALLGGAGWLAVAVVIFLIAILGSRGGFGSLGRSVFPLLMGLMLLAFSVWLLMEPIAA